MFMSAFSYVQLMRRSKWTDRGRKVIYLSHHDDLDVDSGGCDSRLIKDDLKSMHIQCDCCRKDDNHSKLCPRAKIIVTG